MKIKRDFVFFFLFLTLFLFSFNKEGDSNSEKDGVKVISSGYYLEMVSDPDHQEVNEIIDFIGVQSLFTRILDLEVKEGFNIGQCYMTTNSVLFGSSGKNEDFSLLVMEKQNCPGKCNGQPYECSIFKTKNVFKSGYIGSMLGQFPVEKDVRIFIIFSGRDITRKSPLVYRTTLELNLKERNMNLTASVGRANTPLDSVNFVIGEKELSKKWEELFGDKAVEIGKQPHIESEKSFLYDYFHEFGIYNDDKGVNFYIDKVKVMENDYLFNYSDENIKSGDIKNFRFFYTIGITSPSDNVFKDGFISTKMKGIHHYHHDDFPKRDTVTKLMLEPFKKKKKDEL